MSAPNYQPSNDDTIVNNGKGQHMSPAGSGSGHDEELHRYVTDDQPRQAKMQQGPVGPAQGTPKGKAPGEGIIVSPQS